MKIEEQVLSIEQMKHLQELGVDTSDASMCWLKYTGTDGAVRYLINANDISCHVMPFMEAFPTYSIGDLIDKLKKLSRIENDADVLLKISINKRLYGALYELKDCGLNNDESICLRTDKTLIEMLYRILCWVAEIHKELLNKNNQ